MTNAPPNGELKTRPRGAAGASIAEVADRGRTGATFRLFPSLVLLSAQRPARNVRIERGARESGAPTVGCEPWLGTSPASLLEVFDADAMSCLQTSPCRLNTAQEPSVILKPVLEPVIF